MENKSPAAYRLTIVLGSGLLAATVAGFAGRLWWLFDLFSHFRPQCGAGLLLAAAVLLAVKRSKTAALMGGAALVNLVFVIPLYFGTTSAPPGAITLRAAVVNVEGENDRYDLVGEFVRKANPDVIVFQEVNQKWFPHLETIMSAYPHSLHRLREDNFGIALFSRHQLVNPEIIPAGLARFPSVYAELVLGGRTVRILGTHAPPPVSEGFFLMRNRHLEELPALLAERRGNVQHPIIMLGDLNTSPWCPYFRRLLRKSGLKDSSRGHGIIPSWNARHPLPLRIPIDHILISPDLTCTKKYTGPFSGSDHFPVVADIALPLQSGGSPEQAYP